MQLSTGMVVETPLGIGEVIDLNNEYVHAGFSKNRFLSGEDHDWFHISEVELLADGQNVNINST